MRNKKVIFLVQFAVLLAIEALVCFTPLGSLPISPTIVATLGHLPVIIAAIALGLKGGTLMGFFFGLFSLLVWTFVPPNPIEAFLFTPFANPYGAVAQLGSLVIVFIPRILTGTFAALGYRFLKEKTSEKSVLPYALSGLIGSLTNTFLVLGGIYIFFGQTYAAELGMAYSLLLGIMGTVILTNGVLEAAIGSITAYAVGRPLEKVKNR